MEYEDVSFPFQDLSSYGRAEMVYIEGSCLPSRKTGELKATWEIIVKFKGGRMDFSISVRQYHAGDGRSEMDFKTKKDQKE